MRRRGAVLDTRRSIPDIEQSFEHAVKLVVRPDRGVSLVVTCSVSAARAPVGLGHIDIPGA